MSNDKINGDPNLIWDPHAKKSIPRTLELKNPVYSMFPQEITELHKEIHKHPELLKILHEQANKDVYIQLMEIAAYCKILVAGDYTHADMLNLCTVLTNKLQSMRTLVTGPLNR